MGFCFYSVTDIGTVRKTNQDSLYAKTIRTSFGQTFMGIVCDGMGGMSDGEYASSTVVAIFSDWYENEFRYIKKCKDLYDIIKQQWAYLIDLAEKNLEAYCRGSEIEAGTTLSVLLVVEKNYYAAQVGDSRIFHIQEGNIQRITNDHSYVMEMVEKGFMTIDEASLSEDKNILTRCIGSAEKSQADFFRGEICKKDCFILSSDGFHGGLDQEGLNNMLRGICSKKNFEVKRQIEKSIKSKKENGETDNISLIYLRVD